VGQNTIAEEAVTRQTVNRWYTRPVLFVADVNRALRFYVDVLGFEKHSHEGDGAGGVTRFRSTIPTGMSCSSRSPADWIATI
jgi:predicted enzyme related to lactoylglutathione lyase